ncbi:hypothetical protein VNO78_00043 [Psophocarpus tetragonolobus]|uniref:Uncharacterized protein n=1 Tax=Psophocarpus tetragonolobus TaxID=3891 RepID=A0AAN9XUR1_PSOTE
MGAKIKGVDHVRSSCGGIECVGSRGATSRPSNLEVEELENGLSSSGASKGIQKFPSINILGFECDLLRLRAKLKSFNGFNVQVNVHFGIKLSEVLSTCSASIHMCTWFKVSVLLRNQIIYSDLIISTPPSPSSCRCRRHLPRHRRRVVVDLAALIIIRSKI